MVSAQLPWLSEPSEALCVCVWAMDTHVHRCMCPVQTREEGLPFSHFSELKQN